MSGFFGMERIGRADYLMVMVPGGGENPQQFVTLKPLRHLEPQPLVILAWRQNVEHTAARERGRSDWYEHFELRIAKVERAYGWDRH